MASLINNLWFQLSVSTLLGFITSLISWWLIQRKMRPKLYFGTYIQKYSEPLIKDVLPHYGIQVYNPTRFDIVDLQCYVKIRFNPKFREGRKIWSTTVVPLSANGEHGYSAAILKCGKTRVVDLWLNNINPQTKLKIPNTDKYNLKLLLSLQREAEVRIQVLSYNRFSGAREYYQKTYTAHEIRSKFGDFVPADTQQQTGLHTLIRVLFSGTRTYEWLIP